MDPVVICLFGHLVPQYSTHRQSFKLLEYLTIGSTWDVFSKCGVYTPWSLELINHRDNIASNEDPNQTLNTFPYMVWNSVNANSPAACITQCQKYGYNAAGLEYGSECCTY